jgi:hypothetical protein
VIPLHYRQANNRIEFEFDCPNMASCIPGAHLLADLLGNTLAATWGPGMSGRSPLVYEQVSP